MVRDGNYAEAETLYEKALARYKAELFQPGMADTLSELELLAVNGSPENLWQHSLVRCTAFVSSSLFKTILI